MRVKYIQIVGKYLQQYQIMLQIVLFHLVCAIVIAFGVFADLREGIFFKSTDLFVIEAAEVKMS